MRVLVYPHSLSLGGSQLNAVDLASAIRSLGHDVVVYGTPGPLVTRLERAGVPYVEAPAATRRPDRSVVRDLHRRVVSDGVDIVHGYEWPPVLEARLACLATPAVTVGTVMSMAVAPFIPHEVPLVVGTRQIGAQERALGRVDVTVIEPPVDTEADRPDLPVDPEELRGAFAIPDGLQVVVVSRLADALKGEGLLTAMREVPNLGPHVVLTVVGDGPRRAHFDAVAEEVNRSLGRRAVVLTGALDDPRPAYALADVVLGMGGSALRGMAFGKPLVVQGENGFWTLLTPETLPTFRWTGWYGIGAGPHTGAARLHEALAPLVDDAGRRHELGRFSRETVERHYSLRDAAVRQEQVYRAAVAGPAHRLPYPADALGAARFLRYKGGEWRDRVRGRAATEDFNAVPTSSPVASAPSAPLVVYRSARVWEERGPGENDLVTALNGFPFLWVDPPLPSRSGRLRTSWGGRLQRLGATGWRLQAPRPLGRGRVGARVTARVTSRAVRRATGRLGVARRIEVVALGSAPLGSQPVDGTILVVPARARDGAEPPADVARADVVLVPDDDTLRRFGGPSARVRMVPTHPSGLAAVIEEMARP